MLVNMSYGYGSKAIDGRNSFCWYGVTRSNHPPEGVLQMNIVALLYVDDFWQQFAPIYQAHLLSDDAGPSEIMMI